MNVVSIKNERQNQIVLHGVIWVFFIATSLLQFYESPFKINYDFAGQWITGIILFYLNYVFLVPSLLLQKKNAQYFSIVVVLIAIFVFARTKYLIPEFNQLPPLKIFDQAGKQIIRDKMIIGKHPVFMMIGPAFFYVLIITISTIMRTLNEYYSNQRNKLTLESQRATTELNYLRKQTNPHFLFNSLNSIYSLAHKKSDLVPQAIVTLSELMRYMLYETDHKTVLLEKEISYIKNYIDLQKLRLNNIENIHLNIHGDTKNKFIEPLLLISFIENAFKYGTDYKGNAHVRIKIIISHNNLDFRIENKIEKLLTDPDNSGIGNINIKNRLQMLYPNAHELLISDDGQLYSVHLKLQLDHNII